jgi:glutamate racemase
MDIPGPIGFFDSGIGGLTVLHEALKILPDAPYIYFADSDNAPYGTQSREAVRAHIFKAMRFLADRHVRAVVVACNTATSVAIEDLRAMYSFPIIGMEPAVKPAVTAARPKRVLVFATELTLKEEKLHRLVAHVDAEELVDYLPLQELVRYSERFEFDESIILPYLRRQLEGLDLEQYGAAVLGCTHFLFFTRTLRKVLPDHIRIIDGNVGTVNNLLRKLDGDLPSGPASIEYYISGKLTDPVYFKKYMDLLKMQEATPV